MHRGSRLVRGTGMLLVSALACTSMVEPVLDPRAVPFQPPPVYARWWSMVESCSGLQGSLTDISWYQVPGSETVARSTDEVSGYWAPGENRIVLGGEAMLAGSLVRHEMLHALIRKASGHPREYFLQRCAGLVVCNAACVADAGPAPSIGATVPRLTSEALKLFVSIEPASPSSATDGGVFAVIVSATNQNSFPIVITPTANGPVHTFFYSLIGAAGGISGSLDALDPSMTYFAAGETKRQYFDFSIAASLAPRKVPPGSYRLIAGWETRGVTFENVTIEP